MRTKGPVQRGVQQDSTCVCQGLKDEKELDKTALYHTLSKEKRAIRHSVYEGIPWKVVITQEEQSRDPKKFIGRARNM